MAEAGEGEHSHDEQIVQFMEFSGVEDPERARAMLERAGWDLELAIQEALNHSEGQPSIFSQEGADNSANDETELRHRLQPQQPQGQDPAPVAPRRSRSGPMGRRPQGWGQWLVSLATLPFRFSISVFWDIFGFIWNTFFHRPPAVTDPVGDVRTFIRAFEEKYGAQHPAFFEGSYSQALEAVKRDLKFLLVYLHSPVHQDTDRFCTEVLCNENLGAFLDANVLVWGASVRSPEGARVSRSMRETRYPFLALVCLRDGYMAMIFRQEGFVDAAGLVNLLSLAMEDNNDYLNAARRQRETIQANQAIRTEQERHFEDIQRADREREEARQAAARVAAEEAAAAAQAEAQALDRAALLQAKKEEIREGLGPEPKEAPDGDSLVRLSLKFPSGTRVQRTFLASQSLEDLFNICFAHEECPEDFSLVINFPRKVVRCEPEWAREFLPEGRVWEEGAVGTFADAGITGSAMLFVQDNAA